MFDDRLATIRAMSETEQGDLLCSALASPEDLAAIAAVAPATWIRKMVAQHHQVSLDTLCALATDRSPAVRGAVASNKRMAAAELRRLARDRAFEVRLNALENPAAAGDIILAVLARHEDAMTGWLLPHLEGDGHLERRLADTLLAGGDAYDSTDLDRVLANDHPVVRTLIGGAARLVLERLRALRALPNASASSDTGTLMTATDAARLEAMLTAALRDAAATPERLRLRPTLRTATDEELAAANAAANRRGAAAFRPAAEEMAEIVDLAQNGRSGNAVSARALSTKQRDRWMNHPDERVVACLWEHRRDLTGPGGRPLRLEPRLIERIKGDLRAEGIAWSALADIVASVAYGYERELDRPLAKFEDGVRHGALHRDDYAAVFQFQTSGLRTAVAQFAQEHTPETIRLMLAVPRGAELAALAVNETLTPDAITAACECLAAFVPSAERAAAPALSLYDWRRCIDRLIERAPAPTVLAVRDTLLDMVHTRAERGEQCEMIVHHVLTAGYPLTSSHLLDLLPLVSSGYVAEVTLVHVAVDVAVGRAALAHPMAGPWLQDETVRNVLLAVPGVCEDPEARALLAPSRDRVVIAALCRTASDPVEFVTYLRRLARAKGLDLLRMDEAAVQRMTGVSPKALAPLLTATNPNVRLLGLRLLGVAEAPDAPASGAPTHPGTARSPRRRTATRRC